MAFVKIATLMGLLAVVAADVNEIVGNNQYLPPNKGYNYDRPQVPFSPSPRPTPSYRPPAASPTYAPPTPTYQSPAPTYGAPSQSRPSVIRPTVQNPIYNAPSGSSNVPVTGGDHHHDDHHHEPGMPYDFEYKVKDDYFGTDYSRNEVSDGDVIRGEYRVQLPDGRLQIVKYTADWKNGFNADVSYQGEPTYPTAAASGSNSNTAYPSASAGYPSNNRPSNSYGPPPAASAPSNSYGPPSSGY